MDQIKEAVDKRQGLIDELDGILETAEKEKREVSEDEDKRYEAAEAEVKALDKTIKRLEEKEKRDADAALKAAQAKGAAGEPAGEDGKRELEKIEKEYNFSKALRLVTNIGSDKKFDGREAEMHQEALDEVRGTNITYKGVAIPAKMCSIKEKRTDIDQNTAGVQGTVVGAYVDSIRQQGIFNRILPPTNILEGQTSDVKLRNVDPQTLAWATAENSAAADGGANPGKDTLAPIRLTGFVDISNFVIIQDGNDAVITAHMADFGRETANKIDASLFSTTDVTNAPPSLAGTTGVKTFTEAATYAAPSSTVYGTINDDILEAKQTMANVTGGLTGNFQFVGHAKLMTDIHRSGRVLSTVPVVSDVSGVTSPLLYIVDGVNFWLTVSNTSSGTTSADFIAGDFNKVFMAFFGGLDMVLDPWSVLANDQQRIVVHRRLDTSLLQGESFVKSTTLLS